ncbi:nitrilase-related carbon-nitrogen hydrolase [Ancylobacter sp. IITR112]|uniref:nitrilase-related carbon-nitrogen hydrolase n=1 Tax=Ancylobacter sp. IITR112 TaxID=3138073 RepID=UPI00352AB9DD
MSDAFPSSASSFAPADQVLIALAQLNPVAGDPAGNAGRVRAARALAGGQGAELVAFPELFLSGRPPEERMLAPDFQAACREEVEALARETADGGPALLLGAPWSEGGRLFNAALLLEGGKVAASRFKVELAGSGRWEERRVFTPGPLPGPLAFRGVRLGVPVGADLASADVIECLAETGAEILIAPGASPHQRQAQDERLSLAVARVMESGLPLAWLNPVGGQGALGFDGGSFVLNADRTLAVQLPNFQERVRITRWERWADGWRCEEGARAPLLEGDEADYAAAMLGLRDTVEKNGHSGTVLPLAGDAAALAGVLAGVLAVDALGAERVQAVAFAAPAPEGSADAAALMQVLGVRTDTAPMAELLQAVAGVVAPLAAAPQDGRDTLPAHLRAALLQTLADRRCALLLAPGEDVPGAFDPLAGLDDTQWIRLSRLRNRWKPAGALGPDGPVVPDALLAALPG